MIDKAEEHVESVLGWVEKAEVLEPEKLREKIARAAQGIADAYEGK